MDKNLFRLLLTVHEGRRRPCTARMATARLNLLAKARPWRQGAGDSRTCFWWVTQALERANFSDLLQQSVRGASSPLAWAQPLVRSTFLARPSLVAGVTRQGSNRACSAGLTCAAVRESGGEFSLEAGAFVLADQGVCCIDEFGQVSKEDRCTIHEGMSKPSLLSGC